MVVQYEEELCRPGKEGTGPSAALQQLGRADLPPDYSCLVTLRTLPHPSHLDPSSPDAPTSSAMSDHMLVGSLRKAPSTQRTSQQQLEQSQSEAQTHAQPDGIDAVALWQVTTHPGQGQGQEPLPQEGQLTLRLCHVFEASAGTPTCVVPFNGSGFQLILGDADGGIQLMSANITEREARLVTVRSLPSALKSPGASLLVSIPTSWFHSTAL